MRYTLKQIHCRPWCDPEQLQQRIGAPMRLAP